MVVDVSSEGPAQEPPRSNRESPAAPLYIEGLD